MNPSGMLHRKDAAIEFVKEERIWLELEKEPNNKFDNSAIKLIGCYKWESRICP